MNQTNTVAAAPQFKPEEIGPRCLVIGGAGYVGTNIIQRLLALGCEVRSFDCVDHDHGDSVECLKGDLRNFDDVLAACDGMDTVFHTAAIINLKGENIVKPAERRFVYDVNVVGTENVARAAKAQGVATLVHTSTFNVVMDHEFVDQDESLPYASNTDDLYTLTKVEAEKAALGADEEGGLRVAAVRPGGIWSSGTNSIMISSFLSQLGAGKFTALIGDGSAKTENTHLENLIDAQLLTAKALRDKPELVGGQAYFITDDESINGLEWFRPLAEGLGYKFPKFKLPAPLMRRVGRAMEWVNYFGGPEPMLTLRSMRNLTEHGTLRIDKARSHLGYEPRYQRHNGMPELVPQAREFIANLKKAA